MKVRYSSSFYRLYKRADVRIRKSVDERTKIFQKSPNFPQLNNHALKKDWKGYRSIDISADWRAIYKEIQEGEEFIAYFVAVGTHGELYK